MKRAKRNWWGYAKSMVRRYPDNVNEDERKAVEAAIEKTKGLQNGEARMKVIELMYFKATHQTVAEHMAEAAVILDLTAENDHPGRVKNSICRQIEKAITLSSESFTPESTNDPGKELYKRK